MDSSGASAGHQWWWEWPSPVEFPRGMFTVRKEHPETWANDGHSFKTQVRKGGPEGHSAQQPTPSPSQFHTPFPGEGGERRVGRRVGGGLLPAKGVNLRTPSRKGQCVCLCINNLQVVLLSKRSGYPGHNNSTAATLKSTWSIGHKHLVKFLQKSLGKGCALPHS